MDLILTHAGADFDALASLVAGRKLYPLARIAFLGTHEENIKQFLRDFGPFLKISGSSGIDTDSVRRLILVETSSPSRLGQFKNLVNRRGIEIHIYDHHLPEKGIHAKKIVYKKIGATTTIFTEIIRRKKIKLTSLEATLFVLGIYEDTGSLTFPSTTTSDRKAVQFLISQGANLGLVTKYLAFRLTHDQITILKDLVHSLETHYFGGLKIYIAKAATPRYVGDIAVLAHTLREMESLDAIFILVKMGERIQLVARSQTEALDVGKVAQVLGGGGHATAASASIKKKNLEKTRLKLISAIQLSINTKKQKPRFIQPEKERSVFPLMKKQLPPEVIKFFQRLGLLGDKLHMGVFLIGGFVRDLLLDGQPAGSTAAAAPGRSASKGVDIDVVVEGDGLKFAEKLAGLFRGKFHVHKKFRTAVVAAQNFKIDIATARTEYYERPGALPTVIPQTSIRADLSRRDFTINAMAIQLNRPHYGRLIDYYGGEKDLRAGIVRVIHSFSFIEDPTRIFRAVRFSERYDFAISLETQDLIKRAVKLELFESLTPERVRQELVAILGEVNPIKAIRRMAEFNELAYIHPSIRYDRCLHNLLVRISAEIKRYRLHFPLDPLKLWSIYLMAITSGLAPDELCEVFHKFTFSKKDRAKFFSLNKAIMRTEKILGSPSIRPSRIYELLSPLSVEEIIFLLATIGSKAVRRNIWRYLKKLRHIRLETKGEDLIRYGLKPGPEFSKKLKNLLYAKLNGLLKTREDENNYLKCLI